MKGRGAKGLVFFLVAALVAGGVLAGLPGGAEAAKSTIYDVEILNTDNGWDVTDPTANNESPSISVASMNKGAPGEPVVTANEGITFQMEVTGKAKTERVKIAGKKVKATYYPVTIKKKSFEAPIGRSETISDGEVYEIETTTVMAKDAKGKLYISDTDVDVSQVMKGKKPKTKIGDGTADPAGSLLIDISTKSTQKTRGMVVMTEKSTSTWTTGTSSILIEGSKSALEGMAFPDDSSGLLPTPLVGVPLDLEAGTGTLVSTLGIMNMKMMMGKIDILRGQVWVMNITGPPMVLDGVPAGVPAGVPGEAEAVPGKAEGVLVPGKYNVEILNTDNGWDVTDPTANNESPSISVASMNKGAPGEPVVTANEGITFQMEVTGKAKTERVKIAGKKVKATYYPVTIKKKSFEAPIGRSETISDGEVYEIETTTVMAKDAKGKLYISDTDVDVSQVMKGKKPKTKIGDGTADPAGSLLIDISTKSTQKTRGMVVMTEKSTSTWTTGTSSILIEGSKSALEGMAFPDDSSGLLPTPLVGVPLDLEAGTGTLVSTLGIMNMKMMMGKIDILRGQVWVMTITPASK